MTHRDRKESLSSGGRWPSPFVAAFWLLSRAGPKKFSRRRSEHSDRVNKAAAGYGSGGSGNGSRSSWPTSWHTQDGLESLPLPKPKRAERLLSDDDDAATRLKVLEAVIKALTKAGRR